MPEHVHWALDVSVSGFDLTFDTTSSSCTSTSTFQYINSQLVAHGFTTSPGISLEGVSNENMERVTKCLLAMLSQRVVCQPSPITVYTSEHVVDRHVGSRGIVDEITNTVV